MHCLCSHDSAAPLREMALGALSHGMSAICLTDHVDLDDDRTGTPTDVWRDVLTHVAAEHEAYRADPVPGLELRMGIELGEANHDPEGARTALEAAPWDLVLGSLHNNRNAPDFYHLKYASEEECVRWNRAYLEELRELAEMDVFDVMAHVGYTSRYMRREGFTAEITAELYREELEAIFRPIIGRGKGIEVNTSGLRQGHTTYPNASVLALYRALGGEIVTIGSDAHVPEDAGAGVREAEELLRSLGFRYVALYDKRKPEMFRL